MFAMPPGKFCGSIPAYRSLRRIAFHPLPSAPPPAWAPPGGGTLFARVSCVRAPARAGASCAGAVRAPDCPREAAGEGLPLASLPRTPIRGPLPGFARRFRRRAGGKVHGRPLHCVMRCHVPHAAAEALRFRSCISFPPSHSVPLPSVRAAAGLGAPRRRDPFCARILRARPCAGGRVLRRRGSRA